MNKNVPYSSRQKGKKLLTGQKSISVFMKMYFIIPRSICNSKSVLLLFALHVFILYNRDISIMLCD